MSLATITSRRNSLYAESWELQEKKYKMYLGIIFSSNLKQDLKYYCYSF